MENSTQGLKGTAAHFQPLQAVIHTYIELRPMCAHHYRKFPPPARASASPVRFPFRERAESGRAFPSIKSDA